MAAKTEAAGPPNEAARKTADKPTVAPAPPETLTTPKAGAPEVRLSDLMALPEPARTDALEKAVNAGEFFMLRSRTKQAVTAHYGRHVLTVLPEPRAFAAAHAIHLLWYYGPDSVRAKRPAGEGDEERWLIEEV